MSISKIELQWFRGAAESVILEADGKSVVIYGDNASGKSSFTDAFEYILSNGRIKHLSHEYARSDREFRNCLRNTKTPNDVTSKVCIYLKNGDFVKALIPYEDEVVFEGSTTIFLKDIQNWGILGHILRQDEIADFIKDSKSDKYSILSPLLGLKEYEDVAENIRMINENIMKQSKLDTLKGELKVNKEEIILYFPSLEDKEVKRIVIERSDKYVTASPDEDIVDISGKAVVELEKRIASLEPSIKVYFILENIRKTDINLKLTEIIQLEDEYSKIGDEFADSKIGVLENSKLYIDSLDDLSVQINCPACGQTILAKDFRDHVSKELEILKKVIDLKKEVTGKRRELMTSLSNIINQYKTEKSFQDWLSLPENEKMNMILSKLESIRIEDPSIMLKHELVKELDEIISELYPILNEKLKTKPPTIEGLVDDNSFFRIALKIPEIKILSEKIEKIDILTNSLNNIHERIREEISDLTILVLKEISKEIRNIWSIIHPSHLIEDIELNPSLGKEKAIDICLKFYGTNQLSPRLTLSEGYRNSLGLSIFIALSNQPSNKDHPIFLDDIVSSFDREHRGMIVDLIRKVLADRQVFLFTHDREWYRELLRRLSGDRNWKFYRLRPWVSPEEGLRLEPSHYSFDEAQSLLPNDPEECGRAIRICMDTELAHIADRIGLRTAYREGVRNDDRTYNEFLENFISEGRSRLRLQINGVWQTYEEAIDKWQEAKELLNSWANRPHHGGSLSMSEAKKLLETCREAISFFECQDCKSKIYSLSSADYLQCKCGHIRWKS